MHLIRRNFVIYPYGIGGLRDLLQCICHLRYLVVVHVLHIAPQEVAKWGLEIW